MVQLKTDWFKKRLGLLKGVKAGRVYTPEEAKLEFDLDLEPDWGVKVIEYEPAESGYAYSYVSPEGWEILPDETFRSPEGKVYTQAELGALPEVQPQIRTDFYETYRPAIEAVYPEMFGVESQLRYKPEELSRVAYEQIIGSINEDPGAFLEDLFSRASPEDAEALLTALGALPEDVTEISSAFVVAEEREKKLSDIVGSLFDINLEGFVEYVESDWAGFISTIQEGGLTTQKRYLLQEMGFGWQDINRLFETEAPSAKDTRAILKMGGVEDEEINKILELQGLDLTKEEWFQKWRELDVDATIIDNIKYSLMGRSIAAGVGDLISAAGGVGGWLGQENFRDNCIEFAQVLQSGAPPTENWQGLESLVDPRFWMTTVARTGTLSVSMLPIAVVAAYGGASIAGVAGLGATGTSVMTLLFGSAGAGATEAALESGASYNQAIAQGMTLEEAGRVANSVYWKNFGMLTGLNVIEFGIAFIPNPLGVFNKLVEKGLFKPIIVTGRLTGTAITEAGQEYIQEIFTRQALGQDIVWDDEMKLAVVLGGLMGGGVGVAGTLFQTITDRTKADLTSEQKQVFDGKKAEFIEQGIAEGAAELRALDHLVETDESVKNKLEDNAKRVAQEQAIEQVKTGDKIEDFAWDYTIEQMELIELREQFPEARITRLTEGDYKYSLTVGQTTTLNRNLEQVREELTGEPPIEIAEPAIPEAENKIIGRSPSGEANLLQTPEGVILERIATGKQKGWWKTIVGKTEVVGKTPESVIKIAEEKGIILPKAITPEEVAVPPSPPTIPTEVVAPVTPEIKKTKTIPDQISQIETLAKEKLIMTEEGKTKPQLRRLMQALTGKNRINQLTTEEADTVIDALGRLEVKYGKPPKIPTGTGLITKEFADKIPLLKEVGVIEKVRPARQVFEKMGLRKEVFEPAFEAETQLYEENQAFQKELRNIEKLVDKERRVYVFRELENPGSQVGLTFNEKRAVNWFRNKFNDWANRLKLPQEKRRQNYVTHIFEEEISQELKTKHPLDPELLRAMDFITPKTVFNPYLQKRLGQTIGLKEDPFSAISAYEARALKVFYYEPLIQKIRVYQKYLPPNSARYLRDYINRITNRPLNIDREMNQTLKEFGSRIEKLPGGAELSKYLGRGNPGGLAAYNFTSLLYFSWLGFKPTSAIRNLGQHSLILAEVGPVSFSKGIALRATTEGKAALRESLVWRSRKQAFVPGIDSTFVSRYTDTVRESALWMFRKADAQNVQDAFLSGYAEAKGLGLPYEWCIKRGDEVAADTQYIYTRLGGASWSQSALGRTLSVLTTWPENWLELMARWVKGRPSYVYNEYEQSTGNKVQTTVWTKKYTALLLYLGLIGLGYGIKEETRLKAWDYTGLTSLRYLADLANGEFPALEYPGAVANVIIGFMTDDERTLKEGLTRLKPTNIISAGRQIENVTSGEKDWLTLLFYLEGKDYKIKQLKNRWEKGWKEYEELGAKERGDYRKAHPELEAQMFITGKFTTLSSDKAREQVLRLIEENKLDTELIDGYEKVFGVDTSAELDTLKTRLGNLEKLEVGKEAEYFKTSDFASEVNRLEDVMGRYKITKDGNPLAVEYLNAKDAWQAYDDLEEADARSLWRQQFPDIEAQMYLWGKVSSFKNPKSAEILLGLMDKYNIPPEAIPAFVEDPSRYDELFTDIYKLKQKWFDLSAQYENLGNSESEIYIEEDDARVEAREQLKIDNPDWVADMRRIEALEKDATEDISNLWAERGTIIDKHTAGSSEAKVWLIDHPDVHRWALDNELLTDDGSDWNEDVLRINVRMAELPEESLEYQTLKRKKEAYSEGFSDYIDEYVEYYGMERAGFRQERYLLENPDFAQAMAARKGIELPDHVPPIEYDILIEKENKTPEDLHRIRAYEKKVPQTQIENYVGYYSLEKPEGVDLWYEDDWFLMEHKDFYKDVYLGVLGNDRADFRKVPSREVFKKYQKYLTIPAGKRRLDFRFDNLDLDDWLVEKFGYVSAKEQVRRAGLTPHEEWIETLEESKEEFEETLAGLK